MFAVHKFVLFTESTFFNKAIGGSFEESSTDMITLPDDEPAVIARVLTHLYLSVYSIRLAPRIADVTFGAFTDIKDCDNAADVLHAHIFAIADRYDMPTLQRDSRVRFLKAWLRAEDDDPDESAQSTLVSRPFHFEIPDVEPDAASEGTPTPQDGPTTPSVEQNSSITPSKQTKRSKKNLKYWYKRSHGTAIRIVYETTGEHVRDLREIVLQTVLSAMATRNAMQSKDLRSFLSDVPDFARDLAIFQLSDREATCDQCGYSFKVVIGECLCGTQRCQM